MQEVCCSLGNADGSGRGWSQGYDPTWVFSRALIRGGADALSELQDQERVDVFGHGFPKFSRRQRTSLRRKSLHHTGNITDLEIVDIINDSFGRWYQMVIPGFDIVHGYRILTYDEQGLDARLSTIHLVSITRILLAGP